MGFRPAARRTHGRKQADSDQLIGVVELLFFAYRDFTGEADAVLAQFEFGRAHHRVLHFVNRRPGLRVADLLNILRITKQSLARVLKELVDRGFIVQEAGAEDRRERRLHVTPNGHQLATQLADLQSERIRDALAAAGPMAIEVTQAFLLGMIGADSRDGVIETIKGELGGQSVSDDSAAKSSTAESAVKERR